MVIVDISEAYEAVKPYFKEEAVDYHIGAVIEDVKNSGPDANKKLMDIKTVGELTDLKNIKVDKNVDRDEAMKTVLTMTFFRFAAEIRNLIIEAMVLNNFIDPKTIVGFTRKGHILKVMTCPLSSTSQTPSLPSSLNMKMESVLAN